MSRVLILSYPILSIIITSNLPKTIIIIYYNYYCKNTSPPTLPTDNPYFIHHLSLHDPPLVHHFPLHIHKLILEHPSPDLHIAEPPLIHPHRRPPRRRVHKPPPNHRPSRPLHHINRRLRLHIMRPIRPFKQRIPLIHRPHSFIRVLVTRLYNINLVLVEQVFEGLCKRPRGRVRVLVRRVHRAMHSHHNPFRIVVPSRPLEIILQERILL